MANCPLNTELNLKLAKETAEGIKQTLLLSVVIELADAILEPILGELTSTVDTAFDIVQTTAETLDNLINSINPTAWVLYIAQYQANKIYSCANYEISLLGRMKLALEGMSRTSSPQMDMYARLGKVCNRIRIRIDRALEKASGSYYSDVPTILNKVDYAKNKANALRTIMAMRDSGLGTNIKNYLIEGFTLDATVDVDAESLSDLVDIRKKKREKIKVQEETMDWDKFWEMLGSSSIDSAGQYITRHMIRTLAGYTELVRLYSGHNISKYRKNLTKDINAMMAGESEQETKLIDAVKFTQDVAAAAFTPYFTNENTPSILDWVYELAGNVTDLTVFGAHAQVLSGIEIITELAKLVPDNSEGTARNAAFLLSKGELLTKLKTELSKIRKTIPKECIINNINDRFTAWDKYNSVYRELRDVRQYVGNDLEKMTADNDYITKLKKADKDLKAIDWDGDEPGFASNIIFTLGVSVIKDMLSGGYDYTGYGEMIDNRINYLSKVKASVIDLREYEDPYIEGLVEVMRDLGLYSLINNVMQANIILKNITIVDSLVAGASLVFAFIDNCVKSNAKNSNMTKKDLTNISKAAGDATKAITEKMEKLVQTVLDKALSILGYGKDLVNLITELRNKNEKTKEDIEELEKVKDIMR